MTNRELNPGLGIFMQAGFLPPPSQHQTFADYLTQRATYFHELLLAESKIEASDSLAQVRNYSATRRSKMIRPIIAEMAGELYGIEDKITPFALATEVLHNAAVDLDDIQDGASTRRRKPATHQVFGEQATTLNTVAQIAMLNERLAGLSKNFAPETVLRLASYCGRKVFDMCDGQERDLKKSKQTNLRDLEKIASLKTGSAIEMSMVGVGILAGAQDEEITLFKEFSHELGLLYQARDDALDTKPDTGKDQNLDVKNGHTTFASVLGEEIEEYIHQHARTARELAFKFPGTAIKVLHLVDFVETRAK